MRTRPMHVIRMLALCTAIAIPGLASAIGISGQGTWESTLQARDLDGNAGTIEAWYDTDLNITWLADANYAQTSAYSPLYPTGYMNPAAADGFVATLVINGISGWRLPGMLGGGCTISYSGTDCGYNVSITGNELAHMLYVTLGDLAYCNTSGSCPQAGWGLTNTGPFANIQSDFNGYYWTGTKFPLNNAYAYALRPSYGNQTILYGTDGGYAWAVHSGDVGAAVVPAPAAAWLFGPALGLLAGVRRRS